MNDTIHHVSNPLDASAVPPPWSPAMSPAPRQPSRWLALISLVVALFAIGLAIGAWFRPLPSNKSAPAPNYTNQQVTDAKSKVCAAFDKVNNAVRTTTARDKGSDYATQLASAVNVRQALVAGSQYLATILDEEPATPSDLASNIRRLVNAYQLLTIELLADAPDSEKSPIVRSGDETTSTIEGLCK
jgi:hypothetical protein